MTLPEFKQVGKLTVAHFRQHPGRLFLTLFSTIAAACVVVWVVSGYDSLVEKFDGFAENYIGRYELLVVAANPRGESGFGNAKPEPLSKEMLDELRADPVVASLDAVFTTRSTVRNPNRSPLDSMRSRSSRGPRTPEAGKEAAAKDTPAKSGEGSKAGEASKSGETPTIPGFSRAEGGTEASPIMNAAVVATGRTPTLVGTDAREAPYKVVQGRWIDPNKPDALETVISESVAEQQELKLGDEVSVGKARGAGEMRLPFEIPEPTENERSKETRLKVVGIVSSIKSSPTVRFRVGLPMTRGAALDRGPTASAVYVPVALAEKISGQPVEYSFAGIVFKPNTNQAMFRETWMPKIAKATPAAEFQSLADVDSELNNSAGSESIKIQAYSATGISMLAALFIIFTTLSMGVHERIRQFAVLRAVALTKQQIAGIIALESLLLGVLGWAGGLLAGWSLFSLAKQWKPELFQGGEGLGTWCIALSGICSLGGALAAAILPAWRATRVSPLEAMAPAQQTNSTKLGLWGTVIGLILIAVNPLVVFWLPIKDTARYGISTALGCTSMAIGFVLLAPATIMLAEKLLGPLIARLLGLNPKLLASQLTTNLWRTLGTTVALTLGLGLFVTMQTWGYSMLGPFTPGDWVPEYLVKLSPTGIPLENAAEMGSVAGVKPNEFSPLIVEQTKFAADFVGANDRANAARQDNCVFIGVDPEQALGGDKPLFKFRFVEGTREDAIKRLKSTRSCLVPDHFAREGNLKVGDKCTVIPPDAPDRTLEYEIAGVVSMDGWHWLSKSGLRIRSGGRSSGLMFTDASRAATDYGIKRATFYWLNSSGKHATEDEEKEEIKTLTAAIQPLADKYYDPEIAAKMRGRGGRMGMGGIGRGSADDAPRSLTTVTVEASESVRRKITARADGIIWALSQLPLITLGVTSIGVINTVLSSIRARRWELGVMRSLGVTRFGLFRLILAEAILVGLAACLLSFAFGSMAGYCGTGVTRYINVRGGMVTPLIIPWAKLAVGFLLTLGLCILAALWPAFRTGREEPLRLLQAGRAAM
jgi:putative ABC transport system permease protein